MKFRYIGEYPAGKQTLDAFGYTFSPGAVVDVDGQHAIGKLSANRFFECVRVAPKAEEPAKKVEDSAAGPSKDELLKVAHDKGVKVDARWSEQRIADAISGKK